MVDLSVRTNSCFPTEVEHVGKWGDDIFDDSIYDI